MEERLFFETPEFIMFSGRRPMMATRDRIGAQRVRSLEAIAETILGVPLAPEARDRVCGIVQSMVHLENQHEAEERRRRAPGRGSACSGCGAMGSLVVTEQGDTTCMRCGLINGFVGTEVTFSHLEQCRGGTVEQILPRQREVDAVIRHIARASERHADVCERVLGDAKADIVRFVHSRIGAVRNPFARTVAAAAVVTAQVRVFEPEMERHETFVRRRRYDGTDMPLEQPPTMDLALVPRSR